MNKVKMFKSMFIDALESDVNKWLEEHTDIHIRDFKHTDNTFCIIYTVPDPIELRMKQYEFLMNDTFTKAISNLVNDKKGEEK